MTKYRCTRIGYYSEPTCPGHTNPSARQGYYIVAESEQAARAEMAKDFPDDTAGFTAVIWPH